MADIPRRIARLAKHGRQPEDRAAAKQERDLADAMRSESPRPIRETAHIGREVIEKWLEIFSRLNKRPLSLTRVDRDRRNAVVQRCRACRAEIVTRLTETILAASPWSVPLAHAIRWDYDSHLCVAPEVIVQNCSFEEMDDLIASTERECIRLGEREQTLRGAFARMLGERADV